MEEREQNRNDSESEFNFNALKDAIVWEMSARLSIGDRVDTKEEIERLASLIADTLLDQFIIHQRTEKTKRYSSRDKTGGH